MHIQLYDELIILGRLSLTRKLRSLLNQLIDIRHRSRPNVKAVDRNVCLEHIEALPFDKP